MSKDVLEQGRVMFREMAQRGREASRDLAAQRRALQALGLAAVEAQEMLGDAVEQYGADLTEDARRALDLVRRSAVERLEQAGVALDGAVGEALDLTRHRVLKARPRAGVAAPRVATVVRAGVRVGGTRVRDAEVVIDEPEAR